MRMADSRSNRLHELHLLHYLQIPVRTLSPIADGEGRDPRTACPFRIGSALPPPDCNQPQNACHVSVESWSSAPTTKLYHGALGFLPSTLKMLHFDTRKSLIINECQLDYFRSSHSSSTRCEITVNSHANDRVSPAPFTIVQPSRGVRCVCWLGACSPDQKHSPNLALPSNPQLIKIHA